MDKPFLYRRRAFPAVLLLPAILLLAGCAALPAAAPEALPTPPDRWQEPLPAEAAPRPGADWWERFGSPRLAALVARVQGENLDVAQAAARVEQAAAAARVAGGPRYPSLEANLGRRREGNLDGARTAAGNRVEAGLEARYEADLWGRNRQLQQGALAELAASRHARDTVQLSMSARVAQSWLTQVALGERRALAAASLDLARRMERLVAARQGAGAATALDLALQRSVVAAQEGRMAALAQQEADNRQRLRALLGGGEVPVDGRLAGLEAPGVAAGLPAELLLRRPDIAEAEARLQAADGNLQAARAALLPRLDLSLGLQAAAGGAAALFEHPLYSLGAALTAPLFNGGRLVGQRDQAEALRRERLLAYRQSLVNACMEVETALAAVAGLEQRLGAAREELRQAETAVLLAEKRYRAGAETLLMLLESQRSLYAGREQLAQLQQARLLAAVDLFRALGGGWQHPAGAGEGIGEATGEQAAAPPWG